MPSTNQANGGIVTVMTLSPPPAGERRPHETSARAMMTSQSKDFFIQNRFSPAKLTFRHNGTKSEGLKRVH